MTRTTTDQPLPTVEGIVAASRAIDSTFLDSPLVEQAAANAALGLRLLAKVETLNPIRSFKGRGTDWWMASLDDDDTPIVSASAGNFGQGLACAAAKRARALTIFASTHANPAKIAAMQRLGAAVVQEGEDFDSAKAAARRYADRNGCVFVEDGAERLIAEGAGTIAKEITEALDPRGIELDALFCPLGNGALLTGVGAWLEARTPSCRVIGVVAASAPAMKLSWESGSLVSTPAAATIADGIAVREPVPYALASMRATVDDVVAVDDDVIAAACAFCLEHYGLVVEPAGAVGVAAILADPSPFASRTVATVLCGSNVLPAGAP